ncbi:MAG: hypothetical protein ACXU86_02735 [Archangium sp.]
MKMKLWLTGTVALALGAVGCSSPPKPQEVANTTASQSGAMVRSVGSSLRMMNQMSAFSSLGDAANVLTGSFSGVPVTGTPSCGTPDTAPCAPTTTTTTTVTMPSPPDEATSEAQAALVEKYLRERIFTEANVEKTEGDSTLFRIHGVDVCSDGTTTPSPDCVQAVDKAELRIRATREGDKGMNLELLVGPDLLEPMSLAFTDNRVGVTLDLKGIKDTVQFLDAEQAQQLPRVMVGKVELALTSQGAQDITFQASILDALSLEWDGTGGSYSFSSAKAAPLAELRAWQQDGANHASISLNLSTTEFRAPYTGSAAQFSGQQWVVSLSGLSYEMEARDQSNELAIAHIGLGEAQSYVSLGDQKLFTADLNALSGQHFDLNLTKDAAGQPVVSVKPEFDLAMGVALAALASDPSYSVPSYYDNDTYRVRLSGGEAPSVRAVPANDATGFPGGLQVVSGELSLSATAAQVSVPTGKCLVGRDTAPEGSHPLLGHFDTVDCP